MLPLWQPTPAPRRNHKVMIAAVQVERRQPSEEARPSKCPPPRSCYPNFLSRKSSATQAVADATAATPTRLTQ